MLSRYILLTSEANELQREEEPHVWEQPGRETPGTHLAPRLPASEMFSYRHRFPVEMSLGIPPWFLVQQTSRGWRCPDRDTAQARFRRRATHALCNLQGSCESSAHTGTGRTRAPRLAIRKIYTPVGSFSFAKLKQTPEPPPKAAAEGGCAPPGGRSQLQPTLLRDALVGARPDLQVLLLTAALERNSLRALTTEGTWQPVFLKQ